MCLQLSILLSQLRVSYSISCRAFIILTTMLCVVNNGSFLQDSHITPLEDMYPWGRDPIDAEKLWILSERIVDQKFDY